MRIACIISKITLSGGAERVMCELCNALSERGHEVHLITQEKQTGETYYIDKRVILENTDIGCSVKGFRGIIRNRALHCILKNNQFDVAVSFITEMNIGAIIASLGTKVPMVVSERADPKRLKGRILGLLCAAAYPFAKGYVFQTEEARDYFPAKIADVSEIIPNPIIEGLPDKKDYTAGKKIIAVGRLTAQKNYPMMIRGFSEFSKTHPDYTLEIFGKGPLMDELKELAKEQGCEKSILFMGLRNDVHAYMKNADMFIMTSDFEGVSNAMAEAMAIGLPVIATRCSGGGAAFLVRDQKNGLLIDCGNAEQLTENMKLLSENDELRKQIGQSAKEIVQLLDKDTVFDQWERYLKKFAQQ